MFKLEQKQSWYNPYYVELNGKDYLLDTISLFDETGALYKSRAWFGSNNDIPEMLIDSKKELKRKTKLGFEENIPFIIKSIETKIYDKEVKYDLYIPVSDVAPLTFSYEKVYDCINKVIATNVAGMIFKKRVKELNTERYINSKVFSEASEILKFDCVKLKEDSFLKMIDDLKDAYYSAKAGTERMHRYTVADYLAEIENENN